MVSISSVKVSLVWKSYFSAAAKIRVVFVYQNTWVVVVDCLEYKKSFPYESTDNITKLFFKATRRENVFNIFYGNEIVNFA